MSILNMIISLKRAKKHENLVISKEGIRIEIIFDKMNGEKNE